MSRGATGIPSAKSRLEETLALSISAYHLPAPERQAVLIPGRKYAFDFAWPAVKLAVEVNGGEWSRGAHNRSWGQRRDNEKARLIQALGWRLWTFTGSEVKDGTAIDALRKEFSDA